MQYIGKEMPRVDGVAKVTGRATYAAEFQIPNLAYGYIVTGTIARGRVTAIDNRRLARVAKLAGAPGAPSAGVDLHVPLGTEVQRGQPLFTVHAESPGELAYALAYASANAEILVIDVSR